MDSLGIKDSNINSYSYSMYSVPNRTEHVEIDLRETTPEFRTFFSPLGVCN